MRRCQNFHSCKYFSSEYCTCRPRSVLLKECPSRSRRDSNFLFSAKLVPVGCCCNLQDPLTLLRVYPLTSPGSMLLSKKPLVLKQRHQMKYLLKNDVLGICWSLGDELVINFALRQTVT